MRKKILSVSFLFNALIVLSIGNSGKPKVSFTENKGQISDQNYNPRPDVLYSGSDGEMVYHIKNTGISYQLNRVDSWIEKERIRGFGEIQKYPDQVTTYRIDVNWKNANVVSETIADEVLKGSSNYYLTVCPDGITNVKSYKGVTLKNVYSKIDIHYYEKNGNLKYDYIVAPNADYRQIALEINGAELQLTTDGGVLMKTPFGDIKEEAPLVYQNGEQVHARWIITKNVLTFFIPNYDKNKELIIDPLTRAWSTYYGGSGNEQAQSCVTDATGNVYLYGHTESSNLISTSGSHQTSIGGGGLDVFLVKFDVNGVRVWGTYVGGSGSEAGSTAVVDATGNVYISGETSSSNAIGTSGTQQSLTGGLMDAFIIKFNSSGLRLWGTYYGGSGADSGKSLALDPSGNIIIAGETSSATGMVSGGGGGQPYGGGAWDAFVAKFSSSGIRQWGTYYGGSVLDDGYACTSDPSGNVYLAGLTESTMNIASSNAYQPTLNSARDAFFVKFNANGARQWGTYFGGSGIDVVTAATYDAAGNIYFCGWTVSAGNVATVGTHQTAYGGGSDDSFIVKIRQNGTRVWGTYIGGTASDHINFSICDSTYIYVAGQTSSATAISTSDAYQIIKDGGSDGFLIKLDTSGIRSWGTYYGASSTESVLSCAVDNSGNSFIAGISYSSSGITSPGSYQSTMVGPSDAFLVKFNYLTSVNIEENELGLMLNAFPNPTDGAINIDLDKMYTNIYLKVYTVAGQLISEKSFSSTQSISYSIDANTGLYIIELQTNEGKKARIKIFKR